ncbi:MAG: hypothetical protein E6517_00475 [Intestinibacter bartlettii]|nr:hypothetical protein [Intestinibacter bartlettii]
MALKRKDFADYLNTAAKDTDALYALLGYGVESLDEEPGAQTDTTCYINDETSSTTVTKYETQFPYTSEIIMEQEAIKSLYLTGRNHETGTDAERDYVRVDMFDPVSGSEGTYQARKFRVANEVSKFSGEGGEKMKVEGVLHAIGDPIQGTFNVTTKTFTATQAATQSDTNKNQSVTN